MSRSKANRYSRTEIGDNGVTGQVSTANKEVSKETGYQAKRSELLKGDILLGDSR